MTFQFTDHSLPQEFHYEFYFEFIYDEDYVHVKMTYNSIIFISQFYRLSEFYKNPNNFFSNNLIQYVSKIRKLQAFI